MADPEPYLTPDGLRERRDRLAQVDDEVLADRVHQFEQIVERARGVAFTPRTRTVLARPRSLGMWEGWWRLRDIEVRTIDEVVVDDVAVAGTYHPVPDQLGDLVLVGSVSGRPTITYTHGLDGPPEVLLDGCAEYVESVTVARESGVSRNTLSQAFDGGTTRYSTPSWPDDRFTGWLEVDRLINSAPDYRPRGLR